MSETKEGDVKVITLQEPVKQKRSFCIQKALCDGKEVVYAGGKFLHKSPSGAAKKMTTRIIKQIPDTEDKDNCIIELHLVEMVKGKASDKSYGYHATRRLKEKEVDLNGNTLKQKFKYYVTLKSIKKNKDDESIIEQYEH